jgi:hypothetical protein
MARRGKSISSAVASSYPLTLRQAGAAMVADGSPADKSTCS